MRYLLVNMMHIRDVTGNLFCRNANDMTAIFHTIVCSVSSVVASLPDVLNLNYGDPLSMPKA